MSGGYFEPDYCYYKVSQFADELETEIENNFIKDDWGYHKGYCPEVIEYLKAQLPEMRKMAEIMRHIDYLYSGDHGEDSFMERVKEVEAKYAEVTPVEIAKEGIAKYAEALTELAALEALDDLYKNNDEGMRQLAESKWDDPIPDGVDPWNLRGRL